MFSDPFFLGMLRSAQDAVASEGLQLVFTVASREEERDRFVAYAAGGHVDGVLLISLHGNNDLQRRLENAGVPTVLSGRPVRRARNLYYVDADNVGGGRLATEHLLASGRRVVATVTGALDMSAGADRLAGYRAAIEAAGLAADETLIASGGFTSTAGHDATARLLEQRPDVDAIVVGSDLAAFGAIRALQQAGRRVLDDVAVIGFDDIREAAEHDPPLTTVRQPIADLGSTMTRMLLDRLADRAPRRSAVLPVELVLRATA